jgi:hypothetical protein
MNIYFNDRPIEQLYALTDFWSTLITCVLQPGRHIGIGNGNGRVTRSATQIGQATS